MSDSLSEKEVLQVVLTEATEDGPLALSGSALADVHHRLGVLCTQSVDTHDAITHLIHATEIYSREGEMLQWGIAQSDLAIACLQKMDEDASEEAIDHLRLALTVFDEDRDAFLWANARHRLGIRPQSRIATRYEKTDPNYSGFLCLATLVATIL